MIYIPCTECVKRGFCEEHPMVTCGECGETYRDDNDWSGPSHSERDCIRELQRKRIEGERNMIQNQVHSKFKVFIPEAGLTDEEAMRRLGSMVEGFARTNKVAIKSVGVEYIEAKKQVVLSLGYRDDEPSYLVKLTSIKLGKLNLRPDEISAAMEKAAGDAENVICHEFFVDGDGEFVMVLLSHG